MNNPARELHSLLQSWKHSNVSVYHSRGAQNSSASALWDDLLHAVHLLDEVRSGLKNVGLLDPNRKMLDSIAVAIFVPDTPWANQNSAKPPTAEQMGSLETWALILDRSEPQFTIEHADLEAIRAAINEARTLLASVPGLSAPHREYIDELLGAALAHLSGEKPDLLAARSAFHEAVGVLAFQRGVNKSKAGQSFLKNIAFVGGVFLFSQVGLPVLNGVASGVGSELLLEQFSIHQEVESPADEDASDQNE